MAAAPGELVANKITGEELMAWLEQPHKVAVVDTRAFSDYVVGHITGSFNLKLSSLLIRRLAQQKVSVADLLTAEQKQQFLLLTKNSECRVVVHDESSVAVAGRYDKKNPLHVVLKSLAATPNPCFYLEGGFDLFKERHGGGIVADPAEASSFGGSVGLKLTKSSPTLALNTPTTPIERHHRDVAPCEILPFLYVGAEAHADNREMLARYQFSHVLSVTTRCPTHYEGITYCNIPIKDSWNQNLLSHFESAFEFIEAAKAKGGRVLIHCVAGISRSPSITIAYIMKHMKMPLADAYALVKAKRPSISPNLDFMGELQHYEKHIMPNSPGQAAVSPPHLLAGLDLGPQHMMDEVLSDEGESGCTTPLATSMDLRRMHEAPS